MSDRAAQLARLCVLHHPVRRALYEFVAAQAGPVSRDAAARAASITRRLAVFHLDQLADAGLLVTSFRRLSGRRGPGAGRPAKLYQRADTELAVALPPREYAVAGEVLAQTVEALGEQAAPVLAGVARETGARLARAAEETDPLTSHDHQRSPGIFPASSCPRQGPPIAPRRRRPAGRGIARSGRRTCRCRQPSVRAALGRVPRLRSVGGDLGRRRAPEGHERKPQCAETGRASPAEGSGRYPPRVANCPAPRACRLPREAPSAPTCLAKFWRREGVTR